MTRATLIAGVSGGLAAVALLVPAVIDAAGDLASARRGRAEAMQSASAPVRAVPLVAPTLRIMAATQAGAEKAALARLRDVAAQGGVLVEQAVPLRSGGGLVRLRLRVSGADKAVIAYADRIEREAPLLRWHSWRAEALAGGSVRIEGEVVAAWR